MIHDVGLALFMDSFAWSSILEETTLAGITDSLAILEETILEETRRCSWACAVRPWH